MADTTQKVNELTQKSSVALTDRLLMIGDTEEYQALVSAVAKKIVEDYAGSTLAGSAQSVKAAVDKLNSNTAMMSSGSLPEILIGEDLNEYTTPGTYRCTAASIAQSLANCPATTGFKLFVIDTGYDMAAFMLQVLVAGTSVTKDTQIAIRHMYRSGQNFNLWADWCIQPTREEVDALKNKTLLNYAAGQGTKRSYTLEQWHSYLMTVQTYGGSGVNSTGYAVYLVTCVGQLMNTSGPTIGVVEIAKGVGAASYITDRLTIETSGATLNITTAENFYGVVTLCML